MTFLESRAKSRTFLSNSFFFSFFPPQKSLEGGSLKCFSTRSDPSKNAFSKIELAIKITWRPELWDKRPLKFVSLFPKNIVQFLATPAPGPFWRQNQALETFILCHPSENWTLFGFPICEKRISILRRSIFLSDLFRREIVSALVVICFRRLPLHLIYDLRALK